MFDHGPLRIRPCTPGDSAAVLRLAVRAQERITGRPSRLTLTDLQAWWEPIRLADDSWLVLAADGDAPIGAIWLECDDEDLGLALPVADNDHRDTLPLLVDLAATRAAELGLVRLQVGAGVPDPRWQAQLSSAGFHDVRHFVTMAIELDGPPPPPSLPSGLRLTAVDESSAEAFHDAMEDAFAEHWEHHPTTFQDWWGQRSADSAHEMSWWFAVRDGEETVAALRSIPGRRGGVYVTSLGVRAGWRGRGIGKALLTHTFAQAWDRGIRRVALGVDTRNSTGATALYRAMGMIVEAEMAVYEAALADIHGLREGAPSGR